MQNYRYERLWFDRKKNINLKYINWKFITIYWNNKNIYIINKKMPFNKKKMPFNSRKKAFFML